ncbi:MAG: GH3 auxin-responsive promoter family protein [Marinilabiliales bacterium]|nr:GH3 auxin-responsive promoter family protein [Marinilabiliales bacterium]
MNAHFYEFINIADEKTYLAHELEIDNEYEVNIITGGGLYRYSLNDIVRVKGFYKKTPMLEFIGKKDKVLTLPAKSK